MEKIISITIGIKKFQLTEAAFGIFNRYYQHLKINLTETSRFIEAENFISTKFEEESSFDVSFLFSENNVMNVVSATEKMFDTKYFKNQFSNANQEHSKTLYRDMQSKMIGGVCAGLSDYLNVDISIVRLIFVLVVFFGGGGVLIYIILWIVLPEKPLVEKYENKVQVKTS